MASAAAASTPSTDDDSGSSSTQQFYDSLAGSYKQLFADWDASAKRHGTVIDSLIHKYYSSSSSSDAGGSRIQVLDCACGVGTQVIGLAAQAGYAITATDLSSAAVEHARQDATTRGLLHSSSTAASASSIVGFGAADFRELDSALVKQGLMATAPSAATAATATATTTATAATTTTATTTATLAPAAFDVVMAMDNAVPHLQSDADMKAALQAMYRTLTPGGLLLLSTRDYDELGKSKPPGTLPYRSDKGYAFQVWDWGVTAEGHDYYNVQLFVLQPEGGTDTADKWSAIRHRATYRCLQRAELSQLLQDAGFEDIQWLKTSESGFFQPVVVAKRPADNTT